MYDYDTVRPTVLLDCGAPAPSEPIKIVYPNGYTIQKKNPVTIAVTGFVDGGGGGS